MWDLTNGTPIGQVLTHHTNAVRAVAIGTLQGRAIAVTGSADLTVRAWTLGTP